jgi:hypothetical protein
MALPQTKQISTRCGRSWGLARLLLVLLIGWASPAWAQDSRKLEYEVKAAFLVKFGMFVDWTTNTTATAANPRPFVIGILGEDPFGAGFDAAVQKEKISGRPVQLRRAQSPTELDDCEMVFISSSEEATLARWFTHFEGKGVLTVGEMPSFAARGGMIGFVKVDGKVRFEINSLVAEKSGLRVSAKLLQLSRPLAPAPPEPT